jgi:hypothetical protein
LRTKNADLILDLVFKNISWPRETNVSYETDDDSALFDIDLPEIEDMPQYHYDCSDEGEIKKIL